MPDDNACTSDDFPTFGAPASTTCRWGTQGTHENLSKNLHLSQPVTTQRMGFTTHGAPALQLRPETVDPDLQRAACRTRADTTVAPAHRRQEGVQSGQPSKTAGDLAEAVHSRSALYGSRGSPSVSRQAFAAALLIGSRLTVQCPCGRSLHPVSRAAAWMRRSAEAASRP